MAEDYWIAEILSAALNEDELVIRLEWVERVDTEKPVIQFRLKGGNYSQDAIALLTANLFDGVEIYFQEENSQKYIEIAFDYPGNIDLRLEYAECERQETSYTIDELTAKLNHIRKHYESQLDVYWKENKKLQVILHRLRLELGKELDRLERKKNFFANTEKADRFAERLQCYQRVFDLIDRFEKDDAV